MQRDTTTASRGSPRDRRREWDRGGTKGTPLCLFRRKGEDPKGLSSSCIVLGLSCSILIFSEFFYKTCLSVAFKTSMVFLRLWITDTFHYPSLAFSTKAHV